MTIKLSAQNLDAISASAATPSYDRSTLSAGIVHFGVGNFHRAHQAVYLDDLCQRGLTDWSITGSGVLSGDAAMAEPVHVVVSDEKGKHVYGDGVPE